MSIVSADPADQSAEFDAAFASHERRLFAIAFSILRDPAEAEDAVQETAVLAWRAWHQRAHDDKTGAWMATICVRHTLRRRQSLLKRLFLSDVVKTELAAADSYLTDHGRWTDLHRAYGHLSPQQRAVVTLHYQHGYTVAEAGALMGCSAGAAASHLSRGLAKLRAQLTGGDGDA